MVIVLLANGFEEIEALTPVDMLRRAGVDVQTVAIGGKGADRRQVTGAHGISVLADLAEQSFAMPNAMDMVVLPGGMPGARHLDESDTVDRILQLARARGAYLAAICAAPLVLGHRGYLNGVRATCYPGFESELHGAILCDPIDVICDGNVITAPGMGYAQQFSLKLVELLVSGARADELRRAVITPSV